MLQVSHTFLQISGSNERSFLIFKPECFEWVASPTSQPSSSLWAIDWRRWWSSSLWWNDIENREENINHYYITHITTLFTLD